MKAKSKGKKRSKNKRTRYNGRRRPLSYTVQAQGAISIPKAEYCRVKVEKIRVRPEQSMTDEDVVSSIAEGFIITGQIHPVIVRRAVTGYELIWGADVLAAAQVAGVKRIECRLFAGNDDEARLVQIAECLFRKELTALEKAGHWREWADTVLRTKGLFSGQPVPKRGRPEGDLRKIAHLLPAYGGRTAEARKKMLARAFKIARLPSDVKTAIKSAGLDDNQSVLLAIASVGDAEAQHRKLSQLLKKLADVPEVQSPPLQPAEPPTTSDDDSGEHEDTHPGARKNRAGKDDEDDGEVSADDGGEREEASDNSDEDRSEVHVAVSETDFRQLRKFWKDQGGIELWHHTPMTVRKEFIDWLNRRPCRANSDVDLYFKDVFAGRKKIRVPVLKAHARSKGFSEEQVVKYLSATGYRIKKVGRSGFAPRFYMNRDPHFSGISSVSNDELEASYNASIDALVHIIDQQTPTNLSKKLDDYYEM